jgi:hypothetical protein
MLKYEPGVAKAKRDIHRVAVEMQKAGFLKPSTNPDDLARTAWLDLDGVTDKWVSGVKVEKVAGGGPAPKLTRAEFAALFDGVSCCPGGACLGCCGELGKGLLPLNGAWAQIRAAPLEGLGNPEGGAVLAKTRN